MRSAIDALDAAALSGTASCASKTARIVFTTHEVDPFATTSRFSIRD